MRRINGEWRAESWGVARGEMRILRLLRKVELMERIHNSRA